MARCWRGPRPEHWLGTDSFGRDVLSRIIYGARTALAIGFLVVVPRLDGIGAVIGVVSAYFGGKIDLVIQRVMDVLLSFPIIVLAITVVAVLGKCPVLGLDLNLIIAIAIPMLPEGGAGGALLRAGRSANCRTSTPRAPPAIRMRASSSATWRRTSSRPT